MTADRTVQQSQWLYVPNILAYFRILLQFWIINAYSRTNPLYYAIGYIVGALLDAVDGYLARKLNQCSVLGEILDVLTDAISRTSNWMLLIPLYPEFQCIFMIFVMLEWLATISIQCSKLLRNDSSHWKKRQTQTDLPKIVRLYFSNSFKNPLGITGILGMFFYSLQLYLRHHFIVFQTNLILGCIEYVLGFGQILSSCIQLYFIIQYLCLLTTKTQNRQIY